MKTLWYITKKDLLQITKDRSGLILMLVVPLILISIVGFAFWFSKAGSILTPRFLQVSEAAADRLEGLCAVWHRNEQ